MNQSSLQGDIRVFYTLYNLGAHRTPALAPGDRPRTLPYQLLKACRARLNSINTALSNGSFYSLLQKMINFNLLRVDESDELRLKLIKSSPVVATPTGCKFFWSELGTFLQDALHPPFGPFVAGLNLIILTENADFLALWLERARLYLIEYNHMHRQESGAPSSEGVDLLALNDWHKLEHWALGKVVEKIKRQYLGKG